MTFDSGAFMIAGTAIAIAGVGLYLWDTRGAPAMSSYSTPSNSQYTSSSYNDRDSYFGGRRSKKNKKHLKSKTKRR